MRLLRLHQSLHPIMGIGFSVCALSVIQILLSICANIEGKAYLSEHEQMIRTWYRNLIATTFQIEFIK